MANYGPSSGFLFIAGVNATPDSNTLSEAIEQVIEETHSLGDSWEEHLTVGIGKVTLAADGSIYDDRVLGALSVYDNTTGPLYSQSPPTFAAVLALWGFAGITEGADCSMTSGDYFNKLSRVASKDALTKVNAEHTISGQLYQGRILLENDTVITDGSTLAGVAPKGGLDQGTDHRLHHYAIDTISVANPTHVVTEDPHDLVTGDTVIFYDTVTTPTLLTSRYAVTVVNSTEFTVPVNVTVGETSAGYFVKVNPSGAVLDLHAVAFTAGGTHVTYVVLDSPDDDTYSTLQTFTNVTAAPFSERKTDSGTVDRYLGVTYTFQALTGTPIAAAVIGVAR